MKGFFLSLLGAIGIVSATSTIKEGDQAYNFRLLSDEGKVVQLSDYRGKWVVLYFYPKADTPGCTAQAKEYSGLINSFRKHNAEVFGVSTDSVDSIRRFKQKYGFNITFLSDPEGKVARSYGVRVILGFCSRDTILINPEGKVERIYRGVDPSTDAKKVLDYITSRKS
ncbi:peroxiredoxin [Thermocrinis sp.]